METLAKKRVKPTNTDVLPSSDKKNKPRSRSPLPESYPRRSREGQGDVITTASHIPILPVGVPLSTAPVSETYYDAYWADGSRWGSAMPLGSSSTSWDHQHQLQLDVVATTCPGSATTDGAHSTFPSLSSTALTYPIAAIPNVAVSDRTHGGDGGISGNHPSKSFAEWQCHSTPPPPVSLVSHQSMSYPDAHTNNPDQPQSITLRKQPFSPGSEEADFAPGFTSPGFGVAAESNFEPLIVNHVGTSASAFHHHNHHNHHHEKQQFHEDNTSFSHHHDRYPVPYYQSGHSAYQHNLPGQDTVTFYLSPEPWYYADASGSSLHPTSTPNLTGEGHSTQIDKLASETGKESSNTVFDDRHDAPPSLANSPSDTTKFERSRRPRGQLQPKDREETSKTRKLKACIRCRMQKIRCIPAPRNPETEFCMCCRKILVLETKKVIHRIPCLRWNLNEVVLFRAGGLGLTQRWAGVCVEDIEPSDWADERVITISVSISKLLCDPMELKVRRFKPNSTDVQYRRYRDQETERQVLITTPAYALADVNATSESYRYYVGQNAEEAIRRLTHDSHANKFVRRTFSAALRHAARMANYPSKNDKVNPTRLFGSYFRLWFASRFTLGSAYVTNGYENLEGASNENLCPGKQYVSRMITAQFDSIGYKHVLVKLKRAVLDELWVMMQKRCHDTFFTVYLIVFMMLHEIAIACQDRRRRAKEQGFTTYYDLEDATAKIKHGADIILGHWHYYKGDLDPLTMNAGSIARAFGQGSMDDDEIQLLMTTCNKYDQMRKKRKTINWEDDPLYLVSQMFQKDWRPMDS